MLVPRRSRGNRLSRELSQEAVHAPELRDTEESERPQSDRSPRVEVRGQATHAQVIQSTSLVVRSSRPSDGTKLPMALPSIGAPTGALIRLA